MESKKHHILIVEDEVSLAKTLALNLEIENYTVTTANTGKQALQYFNQESGFIDLVLLDVMLPEINGFDLCKEFKKLNPAIPVIFLTAKHLATDRISGLKFGADDYLTKPFELEELLLRVNNVIKRHSPQQDNSAVFRFGNCWINFETYEIKNSSGEITTLSRREIGLLKLLSQKPNKVVSRESIVEKLWDRDENPSLRTIDNYILNFRKLFEINPKEPKHFHSIRGVGYKFTLE